MTNIFQVSLSVKPFFKLVQILRITFKIIRAIRSYFFNDGLWWSKIFDIWICISSINFCLAWAMVAKCGRLSIAGTFDKICFKGSVKLIPRFKALFFGMKTCLLWFLFMWSPVLSRIEFQFRRLGVLVKVLFSMDHGLLFGLYTFWSPMMLMLLNTAHFRNFLLFSVAAS